MLDGVANEIVIVRRRNSWEEEHQPHGVWKIAYADFMTALMAFFLVMWLINVTDDSVRRGVAQYFNPVKLASTAPNRKGLNDPQINGDTNESGTKLFMGKLGGSEDPIDQDANMGDGLETGHRPEKTEERPEQGISATPGQFTQIHAESILFTDPYAVLDTLAEKIRVADTLEANPNGIGTGLQASAGNQGGQAYRDPFDPLFWQFRPGRGVDGKGSAETLGTPEEVTATSQATPLSVAAAAANPASASTAAGPALITAAETKNGFALLAEPAEEAKEDVGGTGEGLSEDPVVAHVMGGAAGAETLAVGRAGPSVAQSANGDDGEGADAAEQEKLVGRLEQVLAEAEGTSLADTAGKISVERSGEGTLISLTDDQNFGMFAIGSAEPRPELVSLLERLGKVIAETPGRIVIKGHTDARPFRSKTYDNWRLSSARAHMALYMLTRGGVATDRFERVEGYADRDPKIPSDPLAAGNRRIEIYLLEKGA